jgi:hypothetical protein
MPEHTEASPYLVIFKRRPMSGETGLYQVKGVRSHTSADGSKKKNQIIELNFRNIEWQDATDAAELLTRMKAVMADADLDAKALTTSALPYS